MSEERKEGTVKWFSRVKGYGFIAPDGEETEIFVHFSGIEGDGYRNLEKGQRVSFVVEETDKGPQAAAVRDQGFEATSWTAEPTEDPVEAEYGGEPAMDAVGDDTDSISEETSQEEDPQDVPEDEPPDLVA